MPDNRGLTTAALSGALLTEYRAGLLARLTHSYETYRGMGTEAAHLAAERRIVQLFSELKSDPVNTQAMGFWSAAQPVGVASFTLNPAEKHLFLWDILIYEPHRRMGFGTSALTAIEHIAVEADLDRVQLSVEFGNEDSAGFFAHMGYRFVAISALKLLS